MTEQMEYLFFNESLAKRFTLFCEAQGVQSKIIAEESFTGDASFNVQLADITNDLIMEAVEECYNDLFFGEQAAEIEGNSESGALADACGVQVQLMSGQYTTVAIHPEIMNKLLSVLTVNELQSFISQVAEDIENPKDGPICRRTDLPSM
ncbi:MAG: hypothetical protein JXK16_07710 [Thiotrichales bacterium]|nr:hypothetical protein [Thiotrichales bacterium]